MKPTTIYIDVNSVNKCAKNLKKDADKIIKHKMKVPATAGLERVTPLSSLQFQAHLARSLFLYPY